jgi:hypothetical protein
LTASIGKVGMQHAGFKERNISARPLLRAIIIFIAFHDAYSRTFDRGDKFSFLCRFVLSKD